MTSGDDNSTFMLANPGSLEWGEQYDTAQALANAFEAPVYEPWWPTDAGPRRYRRRRPGSGRPFDTYAILVDLPGRTDPLVVHGIAGPPDAVAGDHDWQPVAELAAAGGLLLTHSDGTHHLLVEKPGLVVQLTRFRSRAEAVDLARTLQVREPMDPPGLVVCVTGLDDGEQFDDAQQLADAWGLPVHEPAWPADVGRRHYVLRRADFYCPHDFYTIYAEMPGTETPPFVKGLRGPITQSDGRDDWWAVPDLEHVKGHESSEGDIRHVVVEVSQMEINLHFRSNAESVAAALTLREFRPTRLGRGGSSR